MDHAGTGFETMWKHLSALGTQLAATWSQGAAHVEARDVQHVLVCGMGGSAAAAELVSGVVDPARVRIDVHRD